MKPLMPLRSPYIKKLGMHPPKYLPNVLYSSRFHEISIARNRGVAVK